MCTHFFGPWNVLAHVFVIGMSKLQPMSPTRHLSHTDKPPTPAAQEDSVYCWLVETISFTRGAQVKHQQDKSKEKANNECLLRLASWWNYPASQQRK